MQKLFGFCLSLSVVKEMLLVFYFGIMHTSEIYFINPNYS